MAVEFVCSGPASTEAGDDHTRLVPRTTPSLSPVLLTKQGGQKGLLDGGAAGVNRSLCVCGWMALVC